MVISMVDGPLYGLLRQQPTTRLTVVRHRGHPPHQSTANLSPLGGCDAAHLLQTDRFPPDVIRLGIWLYYRFTLSLRDVEDLLAERGADVTYETVRC